MGLTNSAFAMNANTAALDDPKLSDQLFLLKRSRQRADGAHQIFVTGFATYPQNRDA